MSFGLYVLPQVLDVVERKRLSRSVPHENAATKLRRVGCRQQLTCLTFGQPIWQPPDGGLRDIKTSFDARPKRLFRLKFRRRVANSTPGETNANRDWLVGEDPANGLIRKGHCLSAGEDHATELEDALPAWDSTTVDLSRKLFP